MKLSIILNFKCSRGKISRCSAPCQWSEHQANQGSHSFQGQHASKSSPRVNEVTPSKIITRLCVNERVLFCLTLLNSCMHTCLDCCILTEERSLGKGSDYKYISWCSQVSALLNLPRFMHTFCQNFFCFFFLLFSTTSLIKNYTPQPYSTRWIAPCVVSGDTEFDTYRLLVARTAATLDISVQSR